MALWGNKNKENNDGTKPLTTQEIIETLANEKVTINPEYLKAQAKKDIEALLTSIYLGNENTLPKSNMTNEYHKKVYDTIIREKNNGMKRTLYHFNLKEVKPTKMDDALSNLVSSMEFEAHFTVKYSIVHSTFVEAKEQELKVRYCFTNGSNFKDKANWLLEKENSRKELYSTDFDIENANSTMNNTPIQPKQNTNPYNGQMSGYGQPIPQGYGYPQQGMPMQPYGQPMPQGYPQQGQQPPYNGGMQGQQGVRPQQPYNGQMNGYGQPTPQGYGYPQQGMPMQQPYQQPQNYPTPPNNSFSNDSIVEKNLIMKNNEDTTKETTQELSNIVKQNVSLEEKKEVEEPFVEKKSEEVVNEPILEETTNEKKVTTHPPRKRKKDYENSSNETETTIEQGMVVQNEEIPSITNIEEVQQNTTLENNVVTNDNPFNNQTNSLEQSNDKKNKIRKNRRKTDEELLKELQEDVDV